MGLGSRVQRWGERIRRVWRVAWPVCLLAVMCLVFFWDVLRLPSDYVIAGNDLTNMFVFWLRFAEESLDAGELPLWNPYLFSGVPFIANPQPALFYPPTWLAFPMRVTRALGVIAILHVWLAGVGMYAWLRSEKASRTGALLAGVVFAFSGYVFVRLQAGHLGVITTGSWLPFLLWAYRRAETRRSWPLAVLGGLPVGLAILAGHTATFVYVALGFTAYVAYRAWERWREAQRASSLVLPVGLAAVMLLVGLALAAVQLLPTVQFVMHSNRQAESSYDFAARFSWPPGYLLTLLMPNFFGEPVRTGYWGEGIYDEFIIYVGVLPLVLALLGLKLRHRLRPFLVALGLGALLLAFGKYLGLHLLFYRVVPLFRSMRAPARAGFLFTLVAAGLTGLVVTALEATDREGRGRLLSPVKRRSLLFVSAGGVVLVVVGFVAFAWGRDLDAGASRLYHVANQAAVFLVLLWLAWGLLTAWRRAAHVHAGLLSLTLGLVLLDLWAFGNGTMIPSATEKSQYWNIVENAIEDRQVTRVLPWGLNDVEQNQNMRFDLRSAFGYDPLVLQRYQEFVTSQPDPRARTYDLLNVGYVSSTSSQHFPDEPDAPELVSRRTGVWVYKRTTALPRAWVAPQIEVLDAADILLRIHEPEFDPRATALAESPVACVGVDLDTPGDVEITRYERNRIEARVQGGGGMAVFSEVFYPGWRATLDGQPVRIVRADYVLRGLCVPAGEHQVALVYDPLLPKVGLAITGLTVVAVVGIAVWCLVRRCRQRKVDAP